MQYNSINYDRFNIAVNQYTCSNIYDRHQSIRSCSIDPPEMDSAFYLIRNRIFWTVGALCCGKFAIAIPIFVRKLMGTDTSSMRGKIEEMYFITRVCVYKCSNNIFRCMYKSLGKMKFSHVRIVRHYRRRIDVTKRRLLMYVCFYIDIKCLYYSSHIPFTYFRISINLTKPLNLFIFCHSRQPPNLISVSRHLFDYN